jgi:hypothetical protein
MNDDSIKIMSLLDELEELIASSGKMPFSEKGIIDLDVAQKIIEEDPDCTSQKYAILWYRLRQLRKTNINWAAIS